MNRLFATIIFVVAAMLLSGRPLAAQETEQKSYSNRDLWKLDKDSKIAVYPIFSEEGAVALDALLHADYKDPAWDIIELLLRYIVEKKILEENDNSMRRYDNSVFDNTKLVIKYAADGLSGVEIFHSFEDGESAARVGPYTIKDGAVVDVNLLIEYMRNEDGMKDYRGIPDYRHEKLVFPRISDGKLPKLLSCLSTFKELKRLEFAFHFDDRLGDLKKLTNLETASFWFSYLPKDLPEVVAAWPKLKELKITTTSEEVEKKYRAEHQQSGRVEALYDAIEEHPSLQLVYLRGRFFQRHPDLRPLRTTFNNVTGSLCFHRKPLQFWNDEHRMFDRGSNKSYYLESLVWEGVSVKTEKFLVNSPEGRQALTSLFEPQYRDAVLQVLDGVVDALVEIPCKRRERTIEEWRDKIVDGIRLEFDYRSTGDCVVSLSSDFGLGEGDEEGGTEWSNTRFFTVRNGHADCLDLNTEYCFGRSATDHCRISVNNAPFLNGLSKLDTLRSLHLLFDEAVQEHFVDLSRLTKLEELKLEMYRPSMTLPNILRELVSLKMFDFRCLNLDKESVLADEMLDALTDCPNLQVLQIDGATAKSGDSLPKLKSLKHLSLVVVNDTVMKNIGRMPQLTRLDLQPHRSRWADYGGTYSNESLAFLAQLQTLKAIDFSNPELSFEFLPPFSHLESVTVYNAILTANDLIRLGRSPNIREMKLASVVIPQSDEKYFAAFRNLRSLSCYIEENTFEKFPLLPKLEKLSISEGRVGNTQSVTDSGLSALIRSPKLSYVSIHSHRIGREGAKEAYKRFNIQELWLWSNQLP